MPNVIHIQPSAQQLTRGETLHVPITLALEQPLKVRGIHARFHGAEETKAVYTTTSTNSKGHVQTHTHTAIEQVEIVDQPHLLAGCEKLGFLGTLKDAAATLVGGGKHDLMQPGEYAFAVDVSIPPNAPPTHVGNKSRIFYELSMQVDIPLARDLRATQAFQVAPVEFETQDPQPVRTRYPEDAGRGFFDSLLTQDVKIEMVLAADRYRMGETIDGIVLVQTEKPLQCRAIRARLMAMERSQAQSHSDSYIHSGPTIELAPPGAVAGSYKQEFSFPAQMSAPLTARGHRFSIDWFVQVEFDVPWAKDPKIRAPITLLPTG